MAKQKTKNKSETRRAVVHHATPGRTRLRIEGDRPGRAELTALVEHLVKVPGVTAVTASGLTGKLLLRHAAPFAQIAEKCRASGILAIDDEAERQAAARMGITPAGSHALLTMAFVALALVQATRGQLLPSALALLIHASEMARAGNGEPTR